MRCPWRPRHYTATIGWYLAASRNAGDARLARGAPRPPATRLADLAVALGANVQPDQIVTVGADLGAGGDGPRGRGRAYRRGARFVDVDVLRPVREARADRARARGDTRLRAQLVRRPDARARQAAGGEDLALRPAPPDALDGLDPERAGRDQLPFIKEVLTVINERLVNWTVVPAPTLAWARLVYPELAGARRSSGCGHEIGHVCRLDEPDPVAAWAARADELDDRRAAAGRALASTRSTSRGRARISSWGSSRRRVGDRARRDGGRHRAHGEPAHRGGVHDADPARTEGVVRSTRPLALADGPIVRGLVVRFEGGRAVEITADEGAEVLRGRAALDEGAARLGEVALVDRESRIGRLGTTSSTRCSTRTPSATSRSATATRPRDEEDRARVNESAIHIDFMIGGDDVDVTGVTQAGIACPSSAAAPGSSRRPSRPARLRRLAHRAAEPRDEAGHCRPARASPGGSSEARAPRGGHARPRPRSRRPRLPPRSRTGGRAEAGRRAAGSPPSRRSREHRVDMDAARRSSAATERENASWACFEAAYSPDVPAPDTAPATETTLTTCDGRAASSAGRNARRHQTPPR